MEDTIDSFIIWAAGFFDGEGCIMITRPAYTLRVYVCNTDKSAIEPFKRFQGSLYISNKKGYTKPVYRYEFSFFGAKEFLLLAFPYLRVKKRQAQVALDYIATILSLAGLRGGYKAAKKMTALECQVRKQFLIRLKAASHPSVLQPEEPLPQIPQLQLPL